MSRYILKGLSDSSRGQALNPQRSVCELGAGLGLCSLLAWRLGAHVLCTDGSEEAVARSWGGDGAQAGHDPCKGKCVVHLFIAILFSNDSSIIVSVYGPKFSGSFRPQSVLTIATWGPGSCGYVYRCRP